MNIQVGDLVRIAYPCDGTEALGAIFRVATIVQKDAIVCCRLCRGSHAPALWARAEHQFSRGVPGGPIASGAYVSWLKRIDPLTEPEPEPERIAEEA